MKIQVGSSALSPSFCRSVQGLAAHAEQGYSEWGVSGSLRLAPSWGVDPGGLQRLWALPDASGLAANENADPSSRVDAEVGYGLPVFGSGFTGTPNVELGLSDAAREYRMGWRLNPAGDLGFEVSLDAARRESTDDNEAKHRIGLDVTARW